MNRVGGSNRIGIDPTESNGDSGKMDVIVLDDSDSCEVVMVMVAMVWKSTLLGILQLWEHMAIWYVYLLFNICM